MDEKMKNELMKLGVDVEKSGARFAGKLDRLEKYIRLHFEQNFYGKLMTALEENDIESAERYSHSLKGDFKNFEFGEIAVKMEKVNDILKTGTKDGVSELIGEIDSMYNKIYEIIRN